MIGFRRLCTRPITRASGPMILMLEGADSARTETTGGRPTCAVTFRPMVTMDGSLAGEQPLRRFYPLSGATDGGG